MRFAEICKTAPVVAILRGVTPEAVEAVADALIESGVRIIEAPLNSPRPFETIERLARRFGGGALIGAGTVLSVEDVARVADAGGAIVVSPNTNPDVIAAAIERGLDPMPGFMTPSEAFAAYAAGARRLKLFPAATLGAGHYRALSAVLPTDAEIIAVGGVGPGNAKAWLEAGAAAIGVGGDLYKPGDDPAKVRKAAEKLMAAIGK